MITETVNGQLWHFKEINGLFKITVDDITEKVKHLSCDIRRILSRLYQGEYVSLDEKKFLIDELTNSKKLKGG